MLKEEEDMEGAAQAEMELAAEEDIQLADERALSDPRNYRINIWTNTVLGKCQPNGESPSSPIYPPQHSRNSMPPLLSEGLLVTQMTSNTPNYP